MRVVLTMCGWVARSKRGWQAALALETDDAEIPRLHHHQNIIVTTRESDDRKCVHTIVVIWYAMAQGITVFAATSSTLISHCALPHRRGRRRDTKGRWLSRLTQSSSREAGRYRNEPLYCLTACQYTRLPGLTKRRQAGRL